MFSLSINTDNAAFDDYPASELARILRKLADKLETGDAYDGYPLMDCNGNRVGQVRIEGNK